MYNFSFFLNRHVFRWNAFADPEFPKKLGACDRQC